MDILGEPEEQLDSFVEVAAVPVKLVVEGASRLGDDGIRDRDLDTSVAGQFKDLKWFAPEVQG